MHHGRGIGLLALCLASFCAVAAAGEIVPGTWQHHRVKLDYYGITSLYTCSGIEAHVRSVLLYLGARKDARASASGCARGPDSPSSNAWVDADFYTLAPASVSPATETVKAQWMPRVVEARRPYFMGDGDCELVNQLQGLITKNFSSQELAYRTDCVPHTVQINGYSVKGQFLMPAG